MIVSEISAFSQAFFPFSSRRFASQYDNHRDNGLMKKSKLKVTIMQNEAAKN